MQNKITKTCQIKKSKRADKIRDILQLSTSDSLLLDACARKTPNEVKELLEVLPGINPDTIRDRYLRTPLHIACSRKDNHQMATSIALLLIESGSDVNNGVGDIDGLQPLHMAVLAGNYQCVLMLLHKGVNIPASDPFRLTPLLLAKLKMDNLRQSQHMIHRTNEEDTVIEWSSVSAKNEYEDLKSVTQVLVSHLANKHITTYGLPSYYGLSDFLFAKDVDHNSSELNDTIACITDKLALIGVNDTDLLRDSMNGLIEKVKKLGISEVIS